MARTRIISQSKAVYVSPTGTVSIPTQLNRVDTFSFDIDLAGARQDVREFGQLARIATVRASELTPTVSLGYYLTDGWNEGNLGFNIKGIAGGPYSGQSQFISGILSEDVNKKEKNIYIVTTAEGVDAFDANFTGQRAAHTTIGFGNATLSNYSANFAVGEIPRADVELECGNVIFYSGSTGKNPAVNRTTAQSLAGSFELPQPSTGTRPVDVLKHGDVTVSFSTGSFGIGGANFNNIHLQSASIEVPLSRQAIEKLGSELPFAKPLEFPINVTCSINGIVDEFTQGTLQTVLTGCTVNAGVDIAIQVTDRCGGSENKVHYLLKNALLDSQNFSIGLDDNETVDLTFSAQIAGANTTTAGVFMSGSATGSF
jgi:hypothetical protein